MSVTFRWTPEQFQAATREAINKGLTDAAMVASDICVRAIGRDHGGQPSKPYNPPNSQSGTLRRSHGWELNRPLVARYGAGVFYAKWLQEGTRPRGKSHPGMAPRPWLTIPITRHKQRLNERFTRSAVAIMKARAQ